MNLPRSFVILATHFVHSSRSVFAGVFGAVFLIATSQGNSQCTDCSSMPFPLSLKVVKGTKAKMTITGLGGSAVLIADGTESAVEKHWTIMVPESTGGVQLNSDGTSQMLTAVLELISPSSQVRSSAEAKLGCCTTYAMKGVDYAKGPFKDSKVDFSVFHTPPPPDPGEPNDPPQNDPQSPSPTTTAGRYTRGLYWPIAWEVIEQHEHMLFPEGNELEGLLVPLRSALKQAHPPPSKIEEETQNIPGGVIHIFRVMHRGVDRDGPTTSLALQPTPDGELWAFKEDDKSSWEEDPNGSISTPSNPEPAPEPLVPPTPEPEPPVQNRTSHTVAFRIVYPDSGQQNNAGEGQSSGPSSGGNIPPAASQSNSPGTVQLVPEESEARLPVSFSFGLGRSAEGEGLGRLTYSADLSSPASLISIENFRMEEFAPGALSKTGGGASYTVTSEGCTAVVEILSGGATTKVSIQEAGGSTVIHELTKLTDTNGFGAGIQHKETRGGRTKVWKYFGSLASGGARHWREEHDDGKITEGIETPWTGSQHTEERSEWLTDSNGGAPVFVSRTIHAYAKKAWGWEMVSEAKYLSDEPGAEADTTNYAFSEVEGELGYGRAKWETRSDGSWVRYGYNEDGQQDRVLRPWKDYPPSPEMATSTNCRLTISSEGGTIERILGRTVSTRQSTSYGPLENPFRFYLDQFRDPDTNQFPEGFSHPFMGITAWPKVRWSGSNVDSGIGSTLERTMTLEDMESGNMHAYIGTDGWGTFSVRTSDGPALSKVTTYDIQSFQGGVGYVRPVWREVTSNGRGQVVKEELKATGTTLQTIAHTYDTGSGRRTESVQDGITVYNAFFTVNSAGHEVLTETDAFGTVVRTTSMPDGRLLKTEKMHVDGSTPAITTVYAYNGLTETITISAGGLIRTSSSTKDTLGRLASQIDEDGRITVWSYELGGRRVIEKDGLGNVLRTTENYLDGQLKSITGPGVVGEYHNYTVNDDGSINEIVHYGSPTGERWRASTTDASGRIIEEREPAFGGGTNITTHAYTGREKVTNSAGRAKVLSHQSGSLGSSSLIDADGDGVFMSAGDFWTNDGAEYGPDEQGVWWHVQQKSKVTWSSVEQGTVARRMGIGPNEVVVTTEPGGRKTVITRAVNREAKTVTTTTTSNRSNSESVQIEINRLLISSKDFSASAPHLFQYDALERLAVSTDPAGASRQLIYDDSSSGVVSNRVKEERVCPVGGNTFLKERRYYYVGLQTSNYGRVAAITDAANHAVYFSYNARGQTIRVTGDATYPVKSEYDDFGNLIRLHTYRNNSPSLEQPGDVSQWRYDMATGLLVEAEDPGGGVVKYTYLPNGMLRTRQWARGLTTTYTHNSLGQITEIDYSDSTPDVNYVYRPDGTVSSRSDGAGTTTIERIERNWVETLDGVDLIREQDVQGRRSGSKLVQNGEGLVGTDYAYDSHGRFAEVSFWRDGEAVGQWVYNYHDETGRIAAISMRRGEQAVHTQSHAYDSFGRIANLIHLVGEDVAVGWDYEYDPVMRARRVRTTPRTVGVSGWASSYNDRGEVVSHLRVDGGGVVVPGQEWSYNYDGIGNRLTAARGSGLETRTTIYSTNEQNQYVQLGNPAGLEVSGVTSEGVVRVSVNGLPTQGRPPGNGEAHGFAAWVPVDNTTVNWPYIEVVAEKEGAGLGGAILRSIERGYRYTPHATELQEYDPDGNLVRDGKWNYLWDGENRLVGMQMKEEGVPIQVPLLQLSFKYDALGRRVMKTVKERRAFGTPLTRPTEWSLRLEHSYRYDGWNLIAELAERPGQSTISNIVRGYAWGADLSGHIEGAGGVGGLLGMVDELGETSTICMDVQGNVMGLIDVATATLKARLEYDPFGNVLVEIGHAACPFKFSTKYTDEETGLTYFGLRYYSPTLGRWINRDPSGLMGGPNAYCMVENNPIGKYDYLGQWSEPVRVSSKRWASTCAGPGDTWSSLAKKLSLEEAEASKWVKNYEVRPKPGTVYDVPNTVAIFTARRAWWEIPAFTIAGNTLKMMQWGIEKGYRKDGYYIVSHYEADSTDTFNGMWKEDGIYGVLFAGHGYLVRHRNGSTGGGVTSKPSTGDGSTPDSVGPVPYKLGVVGAFSCYGHESRWDRHLSKNGGLWYGYRGDITSYDLFYMRGAMGFSRKGSSSEDDIFWISAPVPRPLP